MNNDKLWFTDAKTLETVWYDFPIKGAGCRRGHIDLQDRVWCGVFHGNAVAMFDPRTQKITEWKIPTAWTRPYDAQFDEKTYVWTAGMDNDLAVRLNTQTGDMSATTEMRIAGAVSADTQCLPDVKCRSRSRAFAARKQVG